MEPKMTLIGRLEDEELYVDAIDEAIAEIENLREELVRAQDLCREALPLLWHLNFIDTGGIKERMRIFVEKKRGE